ncbi:MAG: HIT domain-containing protein [Chlamydiia bacterium]|nr:HIT domain-containing protein [Chlamydiia bacterium]
MKKAGKIGLLALLAGGLVTSLWASDGSADAAKSDTTVAFSTKADLEKALTPLGVEEVLGHIAAATASNALNFEIDGSVTAEKISPLRNPGVGNLLKTEVYHTGALTVFCPETPRVPHHLTIAFNRRDIKGFADITGEENAELFATIKRVAEIYKTVSVRGFVIAQFDTPQDGHLGRCVVELIPHLPGFSDVKNIVDKVDCNRYVLFRGANISPVPYRIRKASVLQQSMFWQAAFQKQHPPLVESDTQITLPYTRKESHQAEAEKVLFHQLVEIFQDAGARISNVPLFEARMPNRVPETVKSVTTTKCAFCDTAVIERQLVHEYEDVNIFYNIRKGAKPGSCFLILPKRHTEKVYGLNSSEIHNIGVVRKALAEVIKETHPGCEVIVYIQDDPAVGQTVFHSHEQVVAVDPKTMALTWTIMSLYPSGYVSDEEMLKVRKEFGAKLGQKIKEITVQEKSA